MKKFIGLIILILALGFCFSQTAFGIAQLTQPIVFKDVLRGEELTAALKLINIQRSQRRSQRRICGPFGYYRRAGKKF